MIQTLCDTGEDYKVSRQMDGAVYSLHSDCVCGGIGNELVATVSSLTATVKSGQALIGGNFFNLTGTETIDLTANSTGYLCASIDTTKENGSRGFISFKAEADIKKENINGSGTLRDIALYKIVTSSTEVTSISDVRKIVSDGDTTYGAVNVELGSNYITFTSDDNKFKIVQLSETEYQALIDAGTYEPNTKYIVLEDE